MNITYYIKNVYGNDLMYVADPRIALIVRKLTGKQTINKYDIENLEALGHTFTRVFEVITI